MNLYQTLVGRLAERGDRPWVHAVVIGIVTNNNDPDTLGRVKVKFPWLAPDEESAWARMATPSGGNARGWFFLPEVGDEVLVAFELGDIDLAHLEHRLHDPLGLLGIGVLKESGEDVGGDLPA